MRAYIIRRLLLIIPTLFIVTVIIFFLMRLIPGSIVDIMMAQSGFMMDRDAVEHALGLDVSIQKQYGRWMGFMPQEDGSFSGLIQGDLGRSLWRKTPVIELIGARWKTTLELGLMGLIIAQLIALPIGIYSALRQDTWGDYLGRSFAIILIAVPGFWIATMVVVFPSIWWRWSPSIMLIKFTEDPIGHLTMFIIPALVLGMSMAGGTMRMTRTMMLEVLRQDYIRTAWAKGLKERVIVLRHALKNALIPVITLIGYQMPIMIGGAVIIESIFSLPGIGRLSIDATKDLDYTVVSGVMLVFGLFLMLINLLIDLTYAFLDPRIRYR